MWRVNALAGFFFAKAALDVMLPRAARRDPLHRRLGVAARQGDVRRLRAGQGGAARARAVGGARVRPAGHPRGARRHRRRHRRRPHQHASCPASRTSAAPTACSTPTASPRTTGRSSSSRAAPGPTSSTSGRGSRPGRARGGGRPTSRLARATKRASRVSTCTSSPLSRYDGTWITSPVSSVAGLVCACAVAPFTAGAVSTTCEHDRVRQLDRDHLLVEEHRADAAHAVLQIAAGVAELVGAERELLVATACP